MAKTNFGKCAVCGKIFHRRRVTKLYCSDCAKERERERQRRHPMVETACVVCGKMFRHRIDKICCSKPCAKKRHRIVKHIYYMLHRSEAFEQVRLWGLNHPEERALSQRLSTARARAGSAMPPWVLGAIRDEIKSIFTKRPKGMIVDHIIPLARSELGYNYFEGRPVCGLHVPWNLQYIKQSENIAKAEQRKPRRTKALRSRETN